VAIDVLLAFLPPGYSLIYNADSDYGRGPWFWVMDLNFLLRCALSLAIAGALSPVLRPDGRTRGGPGPRKPGCWCCSRPGSSSGFAIRSE
jgi:hypothetical protein